MNKNAYKQLVFNKTIIFFIFVIFLITINIKFISNILLDLGWDGKKFNFGWKQKIFELINSKNSDIQKDIKEKGLTFFFEKDGKLKKVWKQALQESPNIIFPFLQFTWITTLITTINLGLRLSIWQNKNTLPLGLRFILSQQFLSINAIYEFIVFLIFWVMFFSINKKEVNIFYEESPIVNIERFISLFLVHTSLPLIFVCYSIINVIFSDDVSIMKIWHIGVAFFLPSFYLIIYVLISHIWLDPYNGITTFQKDSGEKNNIKYSINFLKILWAYFTIYALVGIFTLIHNIIFIYLNKNYDPKKDKDTVWLTNYTINKIIKKTINNYERLNFYYLEQIKEIEREIEELEKTK